MQPGSPQKETEKNAAAVSSGIALQEQEKVFGKVRPVVLQFKVSYR